MPINSVKIRMYLDLFVPNVFLNRFVVNLNNHFLKCVRLYNNYMPEQNVFVEHYALCGNKLGKTIFSIIKGHKATRLWCHEYACQIWSLIDQKLWHGKTTQNWRGDLHVGLIGSGINGFSYLKVGGVTRSKPFYNRSGYLPGYRDRDILFNNFPKITKKMYQLGNMENIHSEFIHKQNLKQTARGRKVIRDTCVAGILLPSDAIQFNISLKHLMIDVKQYIWHRNIDRIRQTISTTVTGACFIAYLYVWLSRPSHFHHSIQCTFINLIIY